VRAEKAIKEKTFPGCVIGVSRNGNKEIYAFGSFTYEENSQRVSRDTVYDLASITKSIPTASLALTFISENKLRLKDPVKKYIPELRNDFGATIEDLLRYRVKGLRMSAMRFKTFEEIRTDILENGFTGPSGESEYTNLPAYVLGLLLERIGDSTLPALAYKYFFGPLNMESATFFPSKDDCAPTEIQNGEIIQGIAHDESTRVFAHARRAVGHAGLFSNAPDLLMFLDALIDGAFPAILKGALNGLGWEIDAPWFLPQGTFGKSGFTGTSIALNPAKKNALVILSNRTFPERPSDSSAINAFRRDIADIIELS
jgi:CubicO group peptidase (beta-lactamase class C family)